MSTFRSRGTEKWRLEEQQDDNGYDVYLGRRRKKTNLELVDAIRYVRGEYKDGQRAVMVAKDGYETDLTRTVRDRR